MLRDAWVVFKKELLDTVRDRRTLLFMVVIPVLIMPVLGGLMTRFVADAAREANEATLQYAVVGAEHDPTLAEALASREGFDPIELAAAADPVAAVEDDTVDFVVVLSRDAYDVSVAEVHYDNAPMLSTVHKRFDAVVDELNVARRDERLSEAGLETPQRRLAVLEPIRTELRGIAPQREVLGERMGGMLPYVFIMFCFLGALYPAIDLAAGEKERGTLETFMLAPIRRTSMVLGKFGVVFCAAMVSTILSTASLGLWLVLEGYDQAGVIGEVLSALGPSELALIAGLFIPVAALFAAGLLSLSIYAKTFKEAQSLMTPLNIVVLLPAMIGLVPGIELNTTWAMVPVANISLAIKEIVKGTLEPGMFFIILASSAALAFAALAFSVRWFGRESVLFRQ